MTMLLLKLLVYIFGIIPDPVAMFGARLLNLFFYPLLRKGKLKSLKVATIIPKLFPDRDKTWQDSIIKQNSLHYMKLVMEMLKARFKTERGGRRKVYIKQGKEYFEELLSSKRGFTILTGHLGNFEYVAGFIGMFYTPMYALIRVSNNKANRVLNWMREGRNVHLIEIWANRRVSARAIIKMIHLLQKGEILFLVADQAGLGGKYKGPLFGKELRLFGGPFVIGQRTKTPFLPMYNYRDERDRIAVCFEEPFYLNGEDVDADVQKVCGFFEKMMREHPEQYLWERDRW